MSFEISGKLIEKYDVVQINEKFKKREFVIEKTENNYPNLIKFQLVQDKTNIIEPFNVNDQITIFFNIKGNKWKDSYFINLQAWRITGAQQSDTLPFSTPPTTEDEISLNIEPNDDLPF